MKAGKVFCDASNPRLIKLAVVGQRSGADLQFARAASSAAFDWEALSIPASARQFPVLTFGDNQCVFPSNKICRWLVPDSENALVEKWCRWESEELEPAVRTVTAGLARKVRDENAERSLVEVLKHLEETLSQHKYLGELKESVADLIVWSTLCPLLATESNSGFDASNVPSVRTWFSSLANDPQVKMGLRLALEGTSFQEMWEYDLSATAEAAAAGGGSSGRDSPTVGKTLHEIGRGITDEEMSAVTLSWSGHGSVPKPKPRQHPVLPVAGEKNILITSALPYVNNVPHLGNIIGCVLSADVFSRYCQLRNYNVVYICGTDEYGTATETKALQEGLTPQEICTKYYAVHADVYKWFNISFDIFGRTTTDEQTKISQDIFWRLHQRGFLYEDTMEQLYCENCKKFLADRFVEGTCPHPTCGYGDARGDQCDRCQRLINATELKSPRCKVCSKQPVLGSSKHIFLDLPKLESRVSEWFTGTASKGVWSATAKHITQAWLRDGLKSRCITRDLKWGTPVPLDGFTDKVFYVWFDAPIGYLSITANYTDQWEKWWKNPEQVQLYQFMAKDNVPFHSIVFPSCLIGAEDGYTLINHLPATEYLNYEDLKFSKSRGTGVFGDQAKDTCIPADVWRFYLLYIRPETQDSIFNWTDLVMKVNKQLLNNLGNFINRALAFTKKTFNGVLPPMQLSDEDKKFIAAISREVNEYVKCLEEIKLRSGLRQVLAISHLGNTYLQTNEPWVLVKGTPDERARGGSVVTVSVQLVCQLAILIQPYMPDIAKELQKQLKAPDDIFVLTGNFSPRLPAGHTIGQPSPLFEKLDPDVAAEYRKRFSGKL